MTILNINLYYPNTNDLIKFDYKKKQYYYKNKIFELEEEAENKRIESQTSALINYCQKLNLYNNIDFFNNCILTSIRKFSLSFEPDTW